MFFDLIYVAAIARLGEDLRGDDDAVPLPIGSYIVIFGSLYATWVHITYYATVCGWSGLGVHCWCHSPCVRVPLVATIVQKWFNDDLFSKIWLASLMVGVTLLCTRVRVRCVCMCVSVAVAVAVCECCLCQ